MAYGNSTTTNNFAEYQGLVHGFRRAKEGVLSPMHVAGDSALVLSQLRTYRSPRNPNWRNYTTWQEIWPTM
uniref:RNase H type-1 domain-containing protein n=1 Tax=Hyaloperonospora arabidopsidis (strain Emoy2) TaxID=559515 RepID=M4BZV8_HYAAE